MKNARGASLFITELIIMAAAFVACAAVCMYIFVSAQGRTEESRELDRATELSQTAASCYKAALGDLEQTAKFLEGEYSQGKITVRYDGNLKSCDAGEEELILTMEDLGDTAEISVDKPNGDSVFSVEVGAVSYGK